MNWRWWRHKVPADPKAARAELERLKRQRPEVDRVVRDLREIRRRNGFAEGIAASFHGRTNGGTA